MLKNYIDVPKRGGGGWLVKSLELPSGSANTGTIPTIHQPVFWERRQNEIIALRKRRMNPRRYKKEKGGKG